MKKLVSLLLAVAMMLTCALALAEPDGKITIWTWDKNFNIKAMEIAREAYQKDHPDVEIEIQEKLWEDVETAIIAANGDVATLPDIVLIQDNAFQKYVMNYPEIFAELTGKFDYANFANGKTAYSVVDGKNFGVPFDAGTVVGTYRTDFLEEAGYTIADLTDIDWDRFIEIGKDVKAKTGRPMLSGVAADVDLVLIMMQSCGASMFNEDGSVNFVNNDACKKILEYYKTMVEEGLFVEVNTWDEYCGTLSNASVVGTVNGCWILGTIMGVKDQAGKWAMTNMPSVPGIEGATNYSNNGGSSWAIINGKDFDLTVDFMQSYCNSDVLNAILPETAAIATYAPAKDGPAYSAPNEYYNGEPIYKTILEYTAYVPANQTGAYYYDARSALATAVTNYIKGGDLESELQTAEDTVNFTMGF